MVGRLENLPERRRAVLLFSQSADLLACGGRSRERGRVEVGKSATKEEKSARHGSKLSREAVVCCPSVRGHTCRFQPVDEALDVVGARPAAACAPSVPSPVPPSSPTVTGAFAAAASESTVRHGMDEVLVADASVLPTLS